MKRIKLHNFELEAMENMGCNNGNYPSWTGEDEQGNKMAGITCRCGCGCSGLDRIEIKDDGYYLILEAL